MKSSVIIGGKSPKNSRNAADFYATPRECTIALLDNFDWLFRGGRIWEPACGDGAISKVLEGRGYEVISTDLHDRGYGESGMNFLNADVHCGGIITNPPFNLAAEFIERSAAKNMSLCYAHQGHLLACQEAAEVVRGHKANGRS